MSESGLDFEKAWRIAVKHYNELWFSRGEFDKYIDSPEQVDDEMMERLVCNMIRHGKSRYERVLYDCKGKVGINDIHEEMRKRIAEAVHRKWFSGRQGSDEEGSCTEDGVPRGEDWVADDNPRRSGIRLRQLGRRRRGSDTLVKQLRQVADKLG